MTQDLDFTRLRVLVADDEPRVRALVVSCASRLGCTVVEASDGDEAWSCIEWGPFDLVVLDVMMPGMSGWEVCRHVKSQGKTSRGTTPRVLMLTGIGTQLNDMTSPLFAADEWIDKPFSLEVLGERLRKLAREALAESPADRPSLKKARAPEEGTSSAPPAAKATKKPRKKKAAAAKQPVRRAKQKARRAAKRPAKLRKKAPAKKKRAATKRRPSKIAARAARRTAGRRRRS